MKNENEKQNQNYTLVQSVQEGLLCHGICHKGIFGALYIIAVDNGQPDECRIWSNYRTPQ